MTKTTTNRWVLALLLLAATSAAHAQFVGARSLFMMSSLLDNPAAAGQSPCVDMRMGARAQWVGFEGAPNTQFASLSGQLGSTTTFSHGLGGHLMLDQMGPWRTMKFGLAYASRIRLNVGGTLSGGIGVGLVQYNMSASVSQALAGDPAVLFEPTGMSQVIFPTLDLGFMYNTKSTMVGLGMHNVTSPTLNNFAPGTSTGRAVVLTARMSSSWTGGLPSCRQRKFASLQDSRLLWMCVGCSAWTTKSRWVQATVLNRRWWGCSKFNSLKR